MSLTMAQTNRYCDVVRKGCLLQGMHGMSVNMTVADSMRHGSYELPSVKSRSYIRSVSAGFGVQKPYLQWILGTRTSKNEWSLSTEFMPHFKPFRSMEEEGNTPMKGPYSGPLDIP